MHLGVIFETNDAEKLWNGFRLANEALDADHTVEAFLLGDAVDAPDVETEKFNPPGVLKKFVHNDGDLYACGTCLDARDLDESDLRPRSTMSNLLGIVERSDEVVTIG